MICNLILFIVQYLFFIAQLHKQVKENQYLSHFTEIKRMNNEHQTGSFVAITQKIEVYNVIGSDKIGTAVEKSRRCLGCLQIYSHSINTRRPTASVIDQRAHLYGAHQTWKKYLAYSARGKPNSNINLNPPLRLNLNRRLIYIRILSYYIILQIIPWP